MNLTSSTVRVLVAIDVPAEQAVDLRDLTESIHARLSDEAGYLNSGDAVTPTAVVVTYVNDDTALDEQALGGIYEVGVEGLD